jgi:hypothetical protein
MRSLLKVRSLSEEAESCGVVLKQAESSLMKVACC